MPDTRIVHKHAPAQQKRHPRALFLDHWKWIYSSFCSFLTALMMVEVRCYWAKTRWHVWQVASLVSVQFLWCAGFRLWESSPRITADTEWVTLRVPGYQDQHQTHNPLAAGNMSCFWLSPIHLSPLLESLTNTVSLNWQGFVLLWNRERLAGQVSPCCSTRCCSVCFLTWSPNWFLGKFLLRLLILCLLEEIWIMAKLHHFLLCLMMFQSGVLYLRDGCRLPAKPNRQPILPALVPGRAAHCSA